MATHYDTLGVSPGSSTQEIRKAYLRRARALHPDRQMGRDPSEARRAEQAMQQVNVAWNVLSDPKKKSEYDEGFKSNGARSRQAKPTNQAGTAGQYRASNRPPQPQPNRQASAPRQKERPAEPVGDGSVSVWASMPVLIVLGLLIGILIIVSLGNNNDSVPPRTNVAELDVGDCFVLVGDIPQERSCASGVSDGQVVELGPEPGNCPQNTQSLFDPNTEFFLCWARMIPGSSNTIAN